MAPKESSIALSLLSRAYSPDSTSRIHEEKIRLRPLRITPTAAAERPTNQQARRLARIHKEQSRKRKLKPAPLSSRKKRALCLYDIPKSAQKYDIYLPLHHMWVSYVQEVLWENGKFFPVEAQTAAKLCSADFHGAEVEVVRSRCVSRVGVRGIVVKDSKFVFEVVTKDNALKVLPKEGTLFRFTVPIPVEQPKDAESNADKMEIDQEKKPGSEQASTEQKKEIIFELHGDQFQFRASERANRKFKPKFLKNL